MLDSQGFDLWAAGYDQSVRLDEENDRYPFAGYRDVLNAIYREIMEHGPCTVLDIGFGTGVLTSKLYKGGCRIAGIDFSEKMIAIARQKMPDAKLVQSDFSKELPPELHGERFDFIISTYALHHLTNKDKASLLRVLKDQLNPGGRILVGDISFQTRDELEACRIRAGDGWDQDENYFVADELLDQLRELSCSYRKLSACAGILKIAPL